ncbi:MAG: dihydroneopterin aldolase [Thermoleophilia bacterium]|nr:dihydroneopterin aldolase [Thermoleophilia bacterium]
MREVTVEVRALALHGYHGATEEERRDGQTFLFDLELVLETAATETDELADTVDYRDVVSCVREISDGRAYRLLEALAAAVADELLGRFALRRVVVSVRKPDVRLDAPVAHTAVTVTVPDV